MNEVPLYKNDSTASASCYNNNADDRCRLMSKGLKYCDQMTYEDPSEMKDPNFLIHGKHPITSTHIHGLEVRPAFDGNPLSWFSSNGEIGSGYLSDDMEYFGKKEDSVKDMLYQMMNKNIVEGRRKGNIVEYKINKYPNVQQPGTLWYHDHAMSVTKANVALGLYGFYLVRNKTIEDCIPNGKN